MMSDARVVIAGGATVGLFVLIQLGALALVSPFADAGVQAVDDPGDPGSSALLFVAVLVATGLILLAIRLGAKWVLRAVVILVCGMVSLFVFGIILPPVFLVEGTPVLPVVLSVLVMAGLVVHPEWYVIDAVGVVIGAGAAGLFGVSFGPLPVLLLLAVLAVYDAISVYRTRHMLTLADSVMELKLPLVLIIPVSWSYSFLDPDTTPSVEPAESPGQEDQCGQTDRPAFFIGLGDAVMPTILVASAATFLAAPGLPVPWISLNLPALTAMTGTLVGLIVLLVLVQRGRPHAGLPLLNGGAIIGYLAGALLIGIPVNEAVGLAAAA